VCPQCALRATAATIRCEKPAKNPRKLYKPHAGKQKSRDRDGFFSGLLKVIATSIATILREFIMPYVGVTRLRIRSIRFLPPFALHFLRTRRQVRAAAGFRGGALLADRHWTFWTLTRWDNQGSMHRYMTSGAHRTVMPFLLDWCDEASVVHWDQPDETLPSWLEADRRMRDNGRPSRVRFPSPHHATLSYPPPRVTATNQITPISS
jgi:hypothetical protein